MPAPDSDRAFAGSIPQLYQGHLVPLLFEPYAAHVAERVAAHRPARVLEIAAGTGAVTRQLAERLPAATGLVATDLNPGMLEQARASGIRRPVHWQQADAAALPFDDGAFDAVVIQFGAMFFPDKPRAFAESRRVLGQGGTLFCSVWDRLGTNQLAEVVDEEMAALFPADPPHFLARTPHGYFDPEAIARDLAAGGFTHEPRFTLLPARSRAACARDAAVAYCQGTPLRSEIEARDPAGLARATDAVAQALERRFGTGPVDAGMQALLVTVER